MIRRLFLLALRLPALGLAGLRLPGLCLASLGLLVGCNAEVPNSTAAPLTAEMLFTHGQQKARMCLSCHGPQGISRVASYPSLAGESETYLAEQLEAFRSGARDNPMMGSVARSLSDKDIAALAHYYAQLPAPAAQVPD